MTIYEEVLHRVCAATGMSFVKIGTVQFKKLDNGNNIKVVCKDDRLILHTISRTGGEIDRTELPFSVYFEPVQCSPNAPKWTQRISGGKWEFPQYPHVQPKGRDFQSLASAIIEYARLFAN